MNKAKLRKRMTDFMAAIESEKVDLVPIMPLDWAWEQASDGLPEGWAIDELKRSDVYMLSPDGSSSTWESDHWTVTAHDRENLNLTQTGTGRTPAEALIHLSDGWEETPHAAASRT